MKLPKSTLETLSFVAIIVGFFFMAAALLDEVTFQSVRNAVTGVSWFLIAIWCQREAKG